MINTHEKLFQKFIDMDKIYEFLKGRGYKGDKENLLESLIYGVGETDAYTYYPNKVSNMNDILTEEEYFKLLIEQMNRAI